MLAQCFLTLVNVNFNVSEIEISKINDSEIGSEKIMMANNDIDAWSSEHFWGIYIPFEEEVIVLGV